MNLSFFFLSLVFFGWGIEYMLKMKRGILTLFRRLDGRVELSSNKY